MDLFSTAELRKVIVDSRPPVQYFLDRLYNEQINFTTEEIMQNMAIVFDEKEVLASDFSGKDTEIQEISENIEEVRIDALQKRLEEAIKNEDYELATKLRDEINRRETR